MTEWRSTMSTSNEETRVFSQLELHILELLLRYWIFFRLWFWYSSIQTQTWYLRVDCGCLVNCWIGTCVFTYLCWILPRDQKTARGGRPKRNGIGLNCQTLSGTAFACYNNIFFVCPIKDEYQPRDGLNFFHRLIYLIAYRECCTNVASCTEYRMHYANNITTQHTNNNVPCNHLQKSPWDPWRYRKPWPYPPRKESGGEKVKKSNSKEKCETIETKKKNQKNKKEPAQSDPVGLFLIPYFPSKQCSLKRKKFCH